MKKNELWKGRPFRKLTSKIHDAKGRNNRGVITVQGRGGGHKKIYRNIDFYRKKDGMEAVVERIEYDPNRSAYIALIKYTDGEFSYIIAAEGLKAGDKVFSGEGIDIVSGNCLKLENIPSGTYIHNVESQPGRGGSIARSAGSFVVLAGKELGEAILRMPSKELKKVSLKCRGTVGIVSNVQHMNEIIGSAGNNRLRGNRPKTRGKAKNPVDHALGGRKKGGIGRPSCNFKGNMIKGKKTRVPKPSDKKILRRRK